LDKPLIISILMDFTINLFKYDYQGMF